MRRYLVLLVVALVALVAWTTLPREERASSPRAPHAPRQEIAPQQTNGDASAVAPTARHEWNIGKDDPPQVFGTTHPGALVTVFVRKHGSGNEFKPGKPAATERADAAGRYHMYWSTWSTDLVVRAEHPSYLPNWNDGRPNKPIDVPLYAGRTATHWVTDHAGVPVVGATVTASVPLFARQFVNRTLAVTDDQGAVRLEMSPVDSLTISADGYAILHRFAPSLSSRRDLATYVLEPPALLRLRLIDGTGRPVTQAVVAWGPVGGYEFTFADPGQTLLFGDQEVTGTNHAEIPVNPTKDYYVRVTAPGLVSVTRILAVGQGEVEVTLFSSATVHGRVEPVTPGSVFCVETPDQVTDIEDDGRFVLTGLQPGRHTLRVSSGHGKSPGEETAVVKLDLAQGEARRGVVMHVAKRERSFLALRAIDSQERTVKVEWNLERDSDSMLFDFDWDANVPEKDLDSVFIFAVPPGTPIRLLAPAEMTLKTTVQPTARQNVRVRSIIRFRVAGVASAWIQDASHIDGDLWEHRKLPGRPLEWQARAPGKVGWGTFPAPREGEVVHLSMKRTATIRGRLVDPAGDPVRANMPLASKTILGDFEGSGYGPGKAMIYAYVPDRFFVLFRRTVELKEGEARDLGTIVVPAYTLVRGIVRDEHDQPAGGTRIELFDPQRGLIGTARAGPDGRFATQAPTGSRTVAIARHPDGRMALVAQAPHHLVLRPSGSLTLTPGPFNRLAQADGVLLRPLAYDAGLRLPIGDYLLMESQGRRTVTVQE